MIEYNNLLNDIIFTKISNIISFRLFSFIIFALLAALLIDLIFGELPTKIHPVVLFGSLINYFKNYFINIKNRISGLLVVICVCLISCVILFIIYLLTSINFVLFFIVFSILLSTSFSVNMLLKTSNDVKIAFDEDIYKLAESFIVSATIESLTENITDSYVAPVFYYFIFGIIILYYPLNNHLFYLLLIPMVYRISNTMDAMLGYKTDELTNIGFFPAKIDDLLNFIPSRIAGLFVVISAYLLGLDGKNAFKVMMRDARKCPSPNSGYTMATTAGALNIQLIKKDTYILGDDNKDITKEDITKAVNLSKLTILLFTVTIIILFTLIYVILWK